MAPIYDPKRHRPLDAAPWSEDAACTAVEAIAKDVSGAIRPDGTWPTHPLDGAHRVLRAAHAGAAGAVTALRILRRAGYAVDDRSDALPRLYDDYLRAPDVELEPGLQIGESGILTPAVLAEPADRGLADRLAVAMQATTRLAARDITTGATGTLHAALSLFDATGDVCWRDQARALAHSLWDTWSCDRNRGGWFWTSDVFGPIRHYYGACHGIAGNVQALLRAAPVVDPGWTETAIARTTEALASGAMRDGEAINWPVSADDSGTRQLVQWCHGAAGVVAALAGAPQTGTESSRRLEEILLRAGEFVWRAGPVAKGAGLCHGTGGNGYAFLGLYRRTGDEQWLARARAFAMHGIGQVTRARVRYGQPRYTLWTGDAGFAVYLHHCAHPEATAFPGLELF